MSFFDPATSQSPVGAWTNYTPGLTNLAIGNGSTSFRYRREGDSVRIRGVIYFGSTTTVTGNITFGLPAGLTIDTSKAPAGGYDRCGYATCYQGTGNKEIYAINSVPAGTFTIEGVRNDGTASLFNATFPAAWANGHQLFVEDLLVPISGWSTNVNLTTDFQEFAFNTSTSTANDSTSFGRGPDGAAIQSFAPSAFVSIDKTVRFVNPIKETDILMVEVWQGAALGWQALVDSMLVGGTNTFNYGITINHTVGSTDAVVHFWSKRDPAGTAWSTLVGSGWRWRVRKISNGNFAENVFQGQISNWIPFTPTWTSDGTQPSIGNGSLGGYYCRMGAQILVRIRIGFGSTTTFGTGNYQFSLPSGLSSSAKGSAGVVGTWNSWNPGATGFQSGPVVIGVPSMGSSSSTRVSLCRDGNNAGFVGATNPYTYANTGWIHMDFIVDINEWTANINLAEEFQEFLSCDGSAGVAANTAYTPTTVTDPAGSAFPAATISSTTATTNTSYYLTPRVPLRPSDVLILELNSGNGWAPANTITDNGIAKALVQGSTPIGWTMNVVAGGLIQVAFSNAGRIPSATYGTAQGDWSTGISAWRWRVRKISNGNFAQAGSDVYSTVETLTNKIWIDGKPIYRKVISLGTLPISASKDVAHGVTGITRVTSLTGIAAAADGTHIPLPFVDTGALSGGILLYYLSSSNIRVATGMDRSSFTGYAIMEYTK